MRPPTSRAGEQGFSLMELLVAMLITVIVSGAIYGLIATGQASFRREPELADRQQNIRIAMDLIQRDVLLAGQGVPWFGQAFTRTDFGGATDACADPAQQLNGCGIAGTLGAAAAATRGGGDPSQNTDILEIIASEEQCPYYTVCFPDFTADIATSNPVIVREPKDVPPACMQGPSNLLLATNNYNFAILAAPIASAPGLCPGGVGVNQSFTTTAAPLASWVPFLGPNVPALRQLAAGGGAWISQARIARYEIAADPLDNNAPSLWRSTTGLFNTDGTNAGKAGAGVGTWQLVARGIEDLQVEYLDGTGAWSNRPQALTDGAEACGTATPLPSTPACAADAVKIVTQVRVTLSARSMAVNLVGEVLDGNGTPGSEALRGQLQAVITPRAAKVGLSIP